MKTILTMSLTADIRYIQVASDTALRVAEIFSPGAGSTGEKQKFCDKFQLAVAEAFSNSARYTLSPENPGMVSIAFLSGEEGLTVCVGDTNAAFDPEPKVPDILSYPEGGYGLFIIHQLMDSVVYSRESGVNLLSMTKKPDSSPTN
ncbi:MAG: ATP-binding protein [Chlorobiaceae bacterium]|nr:ATP-binding protein [Chlorobiaceae bacterium]NTW10766.1 ATP-binding protein [Chlorobiaceae bacterium]